VLCFDAAEVGEPNLGYIIEAQRVTAALLESFTQAGGQLLEGELRAIPPGEDASGRLEVQSTAGTLSAQLVIGADGAQSAVRAALASARAPAATSRSRWWPA